MAINPRAAMPGDVLDDRQHAAAKETLAEGAGEPRHPRRIVAKGAVADHRVGLAYRQIEHRGGVDSDPDLGQIVGDQARA